MLHRYKHIFALALPIILGMLSQNVLNLVDTAMVGLLKNPNPGLAAVSLGGFANFMCMALLLGIGSGVQATASRRKGEGKLKRMASPLNNAILLVLLVAPAFSALLFFIVPHAYHYLNSDPEVIAAGVPYLQARVLAMSCVAINFAFRGYWNAVNLSKLYMSTLMVMHASNIGLNYLLIFGNFGFPQLGVTGAGVASAVSTLIANCIYFGLGIKYARANGFLKIRLKRSELLNLAKLSLPSGIQQLFFAAGFTALFWIIGQVGTVELAAAGVLINVVLVAILPGLGLGLAATTLVGQALGRKDTEDAKLWGWNVVKVGLIGLGLLGLPMLFLPELVLSPFLRDPDALAAARFPLQMVGVTIGMEAVGLILMNALLGAGASKRVMVVSIVSQWCFFLPLAYLAGPILGYGLDMIWFLQVCYRVSLSITFAIIWNRGHWASINV